MKNANHALKRGLAVYQLLLILLGLALLLLISIRLINRKPGGAAGADTNIGAAQQVSPPISSLTLRSG
jgi:hypothetical protein